MQYDVITIGSATQDVFLNADEFSIHHSHDFSTGKGLCFPFGSKVAVQKLVFASGGGGTNAAVSFARQGFHTACIGAVGDDPNGKAILDELRREGVDAKYFQIQHDGETAYSVVLVGEEGERTILSYKAKGHIDATQVPWDRLEAKWLYADTLGGNEALTEAIVSWAQRTGAKIATNPGTSDLTLGLDRLAKFWKHCAIVGVNREEAAKLTGIAYEDHDAIFKKMDELVGGVFVMTDGDEGVMVSDGQYIYTAGVPDMEVIERTGAGDAFHSAFVAEFIRSGLIEKAVQQGTANASSVVAQFGAKAGILKQKETGQWPLVEVQKRGLK